ncbi:MAG: CidA/LrgA family protein [Rubrivivax sp.]|jgi:holin-like protein|nr:CidA/LrgA family protein [Rubrivivax sp.]
MTALHGLVILLLCQSAGEGLSRGLQLPLPGPVMGLLLCLPLLALVPAARSPVEAATQPMLQHLSLLFVPVGVGVILHLPLLAQHGLAIALVLLLSTLCGLAVTALVLKRLLPARETP